MGSGYGSGVLGGTRRGIRGKQIGLVTMVDRIHRVIDSQLYVSKPDSRKSGRLLHIGNDCRRGDIVPVDHDVLRLQAGTREKDRRKCCNEEPKNGLHA